MSRWSRAMAVGLLAGIVGLILVPLVFDFEEDHGLRLLFHIRGARKAPDDLLIVTMDKASSLAQKGEILASQAYIDAIRGSSDIRYDFLGSEGVNGKSVPMDVHRAISDPVVEADFQRSIQEEISTWLT